MASIDISLSLSPSNTSWVEAKTGNIFISRTDDFYLYGQLWTRGRFAGNGVYEIESVKLGFKKSTQASYYSGSVSKRSASGSGSGFSSNSYSSVSGSTSYSVAGIPDYSSGTGIVALTSGTSNGKISTSTTKVGNTKTATVTINSTWQLLSVDKDYGTDSETVNLTCKVNISVAGTYCVVTFKKEDGSVYSTKQGQVNTSIQIPGGPAKSPATDRDSGEYTVSFNSNGGTYVDSKQYSWSWNNSTSYTFNYWSSSRGNYKEGNSYYLTGDDTLTPVYASSTTDKNWTYRSLGTLPTVYKKGYFKTDEWYYSNGTMASSGDEVKSSFTLSCKWEPQTYQIRYNLNGGQMPEDMGKISDYTVDKTYGVNTQKTPSWIPTRLGYKFVGWSDQTKSLTPIGVNDYIPDTFYNAVNTEYTNNNVTLYAQWEYNNNKVDCLYYLTDDKDEHVHTDHYEYNIDTSTVDPQGDKAFIINGPTSLRSGDYAFLGWVDIKPDDWDKEDKINNGYHGTYAVPPEKILGVEGYLVDIELPVYIKIKNFKNYNDWGGEPEVYYGIWAKTGKYMKINGSWKKVNKCYVKINGLWKIVTDIWTRDDTVTKDADTNEYWPWHHEI